MLNFKKASLLLLIAVSIFSCVEDIDPTFLGTQEEVAIESYISPSDSVISVSVIRSTPFIQSSTRLDSLFINRAQVYISNENKEIQLMFNSKSRNYEYLSNENFKIELGKNYKLRVINEGKTYTSACTVPNRKFTPQEIYVIKYYRTPDVVDIKLKWKKEELENYIVNAYYYAPIRYIDGTSLIGNNEFPQQFFSSSEVKADSVLSEYFTNDILYTNSRKNTAFVQIADENMYKYLKSVKQNINGQIDIFAQPNNAISNITGGKGCFGAYTITRLDYEM